MNSVFVICEIEEGKVADVSLELLSKGRSLASTLQCKLEALVLGHQLNGIEKEIFPYGADVVHVGDDARLAPYTTLPHAAVVNALFREEKPQIGLLGATTMGRDLGPKVSSARSEEHTSELQSRPHLVCRLLL